MFQIPAVLGYLYRPDDTTDPHFDTVCQIVSRANTSDVALMDTGQTFTVQFGDGEQLDVRADELRPWYPID